MNVVVLDAPVVNSTKLMPFVLTMLTDSSEDNLPTSHRLCKIRWRLTEKQEKAGYTSRSTVCVAIPAILLSISPSSLAEAVQEAFESLQDSFIAKWLNAEIAKDTRWAYIGKSIPKNLCSPEGIAELAAEEDKRGRISAKEIETWFDDSLAEDIISRLMEKNPELAESALKEKLLRYRAAFSSLASSKTVLSVQNAESLKKLSDRALDGKTKFAVTRILTKFASPEILDLDEAF